MIQMILLNKKVLLITIINVIRYNLKQINHLPIDKIILTKHLIEFYRMTP